MLEEIISLAFRADARLKQNMAEMQDERLISLRLHKANRRQRALRQMPDKIVTERRWRHFFQQYENVCFIDNDFFFHDPLKDKDKTEILKNAIVLISATPPQFGGSVNTLRNYFKSYLAINNSIFTIWDWDNHHHLHISSILSAGADIYCPSHDANDYELSVYADFKKKIPASAYQWNRSFLSDHIGLISRKDRSNEAYGRFVNYGMFPLRNKIAITIGEQFKGVTLVDSVSDHHQLADLEKLDHWTKYKSHLIIPTLNDVSTRVFDSLITGGLIVSIR